MAGDGSGTPELAAGGLPDGVPEGIDLTTPSMARAYDYALGGAHSFAVDREFSHALEAVFPEIRAVVRANRAFLHRVVRFLVEVGVRQFLDIGSGIPAVGNVHEIAQEAAPEARVVYVDIDAVAVAHSRLILAGNDRAAAIQEDFRHPTAILNHPDTQALLDFDQPVGLILGMILSVIPDEDDPHALVARYLAALCPGSYLAISHWTDDVRADEVRVARQASRRTRTPATPRTRADVLRLFTGTDLVEPGLVWTPQWRPYRLEDVGDHPERLVTYAGVGRKR